MMTGQLRRDGLLSVSAAKEVELTGVGRQAAADASDAVDAVERNWPTEIRRCLEPLVGDGTVAGSALAEAIRSPEGTWRHRRPQPLTLPHHPVVSHRGGYPDGS